MDAVETIAQATGDSNLDHQLSSILREAQCAGPVARGVGRSLVHDGVRSAHGTVRCRRGLLRIAACGDSIASSRNL